MILQRFRVRFEEGARIDRLIRGNVFMAKGGLSANLSSADRTSYPAPRVTGDILEFVEPQTPARG